MAAALEAMGQRGIWLHPQGDVPPLAVMCCGQGAVWPGMGRELYDHFPAARAAMDRIAALPTGTCWPCWTRPMWKRSV